MNIWVNNFSYLVRVLEKSFYASFAIWHEISVVLAFPSARLKRKIARSILHFPTLIKVN